ncbi:Kef-type K+ transport system, predicted NAD-binding component [Opitutaceae bacterium TAV1]|nr:Kef-type K+ transport system, predicted NAD-binding component [Opitutaceae bacterium TAV1]
MPHDVALIATLAMGFVLAFVFGFIANKLSLPPLVGYLLAGVAVGPFTPGFVADTALAGQLAEVGVMLLMFGVGLHFSAADLMAVRRIAVPGAVGQIVIATVIGAGMAMLWGWSFGAGLVLGLSLSVASTVVLLKALDERNAVSTPNGRIAVGWLIVEDLAMVLVLVLLPAFAGLLGGQAPVDGHAAHGAAGGDGGGPGLLLTLVITLAKVGAFVAIAMIFGPRVVPWILRQVARTGSRELFTLSVLAVALGIAFGSAKLFGVSFALGAFFAGVVLSESDLSHKAAANSLPLQDAFAVLFFVSVGMLFDPSIIVREPLMVVGVLLVILVGKAVAAVGIVLVLGYPLSTALVVSASLAQIGEFSFILAGLGISYHLLPPEGLSLILAGALLSITVSPLVFAGADRLIARIPAIPASRAARFGRLQGELAAAREQMEKRLAAHKTFTPEELAERFPLFSSLTPEQREVLVLHFHPATAQPGQRLIRVGDEADAAYFISSGEVEVATPGRKIKLRAGDFFGEMALLSGARRSADVTALDYSKFLMLSRRDFRQFLKKHPAIRDQITALAAQRGEMNRKQPETGDPDGGGDTPAPAPAA